MMRTAALSLGLICALTGVVQAAESTSPLQVVQVDLGDTASLQRGARDFTNYCLSCHSIAHVRYDQLAAGLDLTPKEIRDNLMLPGAKLGDQMRVAMPAQDAKRWFGTAPPDLTDIERVRGADWLYTYLKSFYLDKSRPMGVNNRVFPNVAMPDVLWQQQGWQVAEHQAGASGGEITGLKLVHQGTMSPDQFDRMARDIVNYLAYVSAPYTLESHHVGRWMLLLLALFTVAAWFLKREFWRDVH